MKSVKKLSCIIAVMLIILCFSLFSCHNDINDPQDTTNDTSSTSSESTSSEESETNASPELSVHDIVKNGVVNYSVVRPDNTGDIIKNASIKLYTTLCGFASDSKKVNFITDISVEYLKNNKTHDKTTKEIIIGRTNYDESAAAIKDIGYGDYVITTVGNKIIITGWSDEVVSKGVDDFIKAIRSAKADNGDISIPVKDIECNVTVQDIYNVLPLYDFDGTSLNSTYDCGDNCYMVLINKAIESNHNDYLKKLEDAGYKKYTDNNMNNNLFATYTKDNYIVNASYYPSKNEERIIIETNEGKSLPVLESQNSYEKVCTPMFFQVGVSVDTTDKTNGMCFIMRLSDGSFIIYDGGHKGERSGEPVRQNARRIYEILKQYAPDPNKLVVKAWVITHGHDDHLNALRDFIPSYASKVTIERLLINFPSYVQANMTSTGTGGADDAMIKLAQYSPDTKICKIHPGYKFYLADAVIEFFYTLELYAPGNLTYYNTSSLVSRVYLGGQTMMMTGDMSEDANSIIIALYGKYLKSDIVQVAHHGYAGGSTQFYKTVDPSWAFWPINAKAYGSLSSNSRNEYFFMPGTNLKDVYVAKFKTYACELPFNGSNITITDNIKY